MSAFASGRRRDETTEAHEKLLTCIEAMEILGIAPDGLVLTILDGFVIDTDGDPVRF